MSTNWCYLKCRGYFNFIFRTKNVWWFCQLTLGLRPPRPCPGVSWYMDGPLRLFPLRLCYQSSICNNYRINVPIFIKPSTSDFYPWRFEQYKCSIFLNVHNTWMYLWDLMCMFLFLWIVAFYLFIPSLWCNYLDFFSFWNIVYSGQV